MPDESQRLRSALADRYRVERELGQGGMATVYLAEDLRHGRRVAIKVLDAEVAAAVGPERFQREIGTVARLSHPHILALYDSGVAEGLPYYVMPYVEGESLRARLAREKQLPLEDALRLAREIADALACAHAAGIVHRDIKPENVLLEGGHAVVADFGVARAIAAGGAEKLTATGIAVGTPVYMSPEQAAGSRDVDGRSDLYSLACVLYEMLAGQPPFTGPAESLAHQHLNVMPHPVSALRPTVPAHVSEALQRALAKTPADRYASTVEFAAALETAPAPATAEPARPRRRGTAWAAVIALGAVAALAGIAAWQQWWPFAGVPVRPARKEWILVADFDGPPGDSTLAPAARGLLCAGLDQSRFVSTVPPDQVREALRMAGKPPTARLDLELAKELAYRTSVRAVLTGTVSRIGSAYSVVLRVVDADTARTLVTTQVTARDEDALITALAQAAKRVRSGLGERRASLRATRPVALVMTPSYDAYRLYVQAQRIAMELNENRRAIGLYRAALGLDPDFASAWAAMASMYYNVNEPDSERTCIAEALRRPWRLTDRARQILVAMRAGVDDDYPAAAAAYDQILGDDPNDLRALTNSHDVLMRVGRWEEALDRTRRAMAARPFGPVEADWVNLAWSLRVFGRFDEARAAVARQKGNFRLLQAIEVEMSAQRWPLAESLATANADDPRVNADWPGWFEYYAAQAQFARGSMGEASGTLRRSERKWRARPRDRVEFSIASGGAFPLPPPPDVRDTTTTGILTCGIRAMAAGDPATARGCLAAVRNRPAAELRAQGAYIQLLEARLAMAAGHPGEAIAKLRPLAVRRVPPMGRDRVLLPPIRWALADAYERAGLPDSAATCLERDLLVANVGEYFPLEHWRLAMLYARLGRAADAQRHLAAAERAWDRPDPAIRRMLEEARAAVRSPAPRRDPARAAGAAWPRCTWPRTCAMAARRCTPC